MAIYPKKQSHQAVIIFFVLLCLVFIFRFFEVKQNLADIPSLSFLGSETRDFEKELLEDRDEQVLSGYAELETSDNDDNNKDETRDDAANGSKNGAAKIIGKKEFPKVLNIPKLGINAEVQFVGLNSKDEMGVPSNNNDVAWFDPGVVPGEKGSAVIAGHMNGRSGEPAVFWDLHKLKIGDDVYVVDNSGNKKHFQVVSVEKYRTNSAPMEKIFGLSGGAYLNLVTCGGMWDRTENTYDERLVVFTEYFSDS